MKAEPALRVVVDTNVWISAALSPAGAPAHVVRHVLLNGLAVFSAATFDELQTRLWKPKFDRWISLEARRAILRDVRAAALWVQIAPALQTQRWSRDPDDDAFIRTALAACAPWLVSGDADLLERTPPPQLSILTPSQAVRAWTLQA